MGFYSAFKSILLARARVGGFKTVRGLNQRKHVLVQTSASFIEQDH